MKDTAPEVEARLRELFMRRTPSERIRAACEMFDLARAMMVAGIASEHAGLAPEELRVKIFERTYGDEFDSASRARIVARLRGTR